MNNGFGVKYQYFKKVGFRLDLSCNRAATQSLFTYMRKDYMTLQFTVLVKKRKEGREGGKEGGRKEDK